MATKSISSFNTGLQIASKIFCLVLRDRGEISKAVGRNTIFQKNHFFTKKLIAQKLVRVNQWPLYQNQAPLLYSVEVESLDHNFSLATRIMDDLVECYDSNHIFLYRIGLIIFRTYMKIV